MRIKNWSQFQHFKDRRPPWIKLYRDILDDIEWHSLDPQSSKVLVMCWLIASENEGLLPDMKTLAFRLRMSEKNTSESIIKLSHWLEQDDIGVISERYQDDLPETERETETETKKKVAVAPVCIPDWMPTDTWYAFLQMRKRIKKPATEYAVQLLIAKLDRFRQAGHDVQAILEKSITSGWQDVFEPKESVNKSFAQQAADIARTTVPGKQERDPALVKLDQDKLITKPPSLETLQKIAMLRTK